METLLENEKKIGEISATPLKIPLSKSEKQLVQELVQLPALLSEEKTTELLDLVSSDEVKKYIDGIMLICNTENNVYNWYQKKGFMLDLTLRNNKKYDVQKYYNPLGVM